MIISRNLENATLSEAEGLKHRRTTTKKSTTTTVAVAIASSRGTHKKHERLVETAIDLSPGVCH